MRVDNKGGFTPRGRRLGRGLVAVAALAVLLSATSAQAVIMNFQVVPELSSLGFEQYFSESFSPAGEDGIPYPHIGPGDTFLALTNVTDLDDYGQPDPSNVATAIGNFQVDVNTGASLKIQPGGVISYVAAFPYFPYRTGGIIQTPFGGDGVGGIPGKNAQFGMSVVGGVGVGPDVKFIDFEGSDIGLANIYNLSQTFTSLSNLGSLNGGAIMPNLGGNNYGAFDLSLIGIAGTEDIWSSAIITANDITGFPTPIGGNFGGFNNPTTDAVVTWDGTFLTIPVSNRLVIDNDGTLFDITTFGQIVAIVVPEPSSIAMLACGAIGLVGYAVRRKRKG
jgi:hypothetical protein